MAANEVLNDDAKAQGIAGKYVDELEGLKEVEESK